MTPLTLLFLLIVANALCVVALALMDARRSS